MAWEGRRSASGRTDAGTVVLRQVVLQYLLLVPLGLIGCLNHLLPLFDMHKRAGHDWIARTRVVRDRR